MNLTKYKFFVTSSSDYCTELSDCPFDSDVVYNDNYFLNWLAYLILILIVFSFFLTLDFISEKLIPKCKQKLYYCKRFLKSKIPKRKQKIKG